METDTLSLVTAVVAAIGPYVSLVVMVVIFQRLNQQNQEELGRLFRSVLEMAERQSWLMDRVETTLSALLEAISPAPEEEGE